MADINVKSFVKTPPLAECNLLPQFTRADRLEMAEKQTGFSPFSVLIQSPLARNTEKQHTDGELMRAAAFVSKHLRSAIRGGGRNCSIGHSFARAEPNNDPLCRTFDAPDRWELDDGLFFGEPRLLCSTQLPLLIHASLT